MQKKIQLLFELPTLPDSAVPAEVMLFAAGENETKKGKFVFDAESAKSVMAAFEDQGVDLHFDWGHASEYGAIVKPEAAGWFKPEVRADGSLWASSIEWVDEAAEAIKKKKVRYYSPAITYDDKTRRVQTLDAAALTNRPATKKQKPLVLSDDGALPEEARMNSIKELLGCKADAGEADVLLAVKKLEERTANVERGLLSVTDKKSIDEALGVIAGWKQSAALLSDAQMKLAAIEEQEKKREVLSLVETGIREGKITPAQKTFFLTLSKDNIQGFLSTAPVVAPTKAIAPAAETGTPTAMLSDDEKKIVKAFGIKVEDYIKRKEMGDVPVPASRKSDAA